MPQASQTATILPGDKSKGMTFRHSAGFGRRMEYWIIGRMLKEGLDVYVPVVDDFGIDAVIRKKDNEFIEVQIKARSNEVLPGHAALFAAIEHPKMRKNYYFVFYSEPMDATWIMSSEEFRNEANQNRTGKNEGRFTILLNGYHADKSKGGEKVAYPLERFKKYLVNDFSRFRKVAKVVVVPPRATSSTRRSAATRSSPLGATKVAAKRRSSGMTSIGSRH